MGLHIRVFKPIERVTEAEAADDDVRLLNEVRNIPPGSKNLEVGTGYYRCQEVEVPTFHIPYSAFNWFRTRSLPNELRHEHTRSVERRRILHR